MGFRRTVYKRLAYVQLNQTLLYTDDMRLNFRNSQLEKVRSVYRTYFQHDVPYHRLEVDPDAMIKRLDKAIRDGEPLQELKPKPIRRKDLRFIDLGYSPPASLDYRALIRWRYMKGH